MTTEGRPFSSLLIFTALILSGLLNSCNQGNIYSDVKQIPDAEWSIYNNLNFTAEIEDTTSACDLLITLRNSSDYPYRNIFLFISTTSPQGYTIKDTLEYYLANDKGEWLGKGLGDIHDISLPYKSNVVFPSVGKYQFRIEQGMRAEELTGIIDVGIRIKKQNKRLKLGEE